MRNHLTSIDFSQIDKHGEEAIGEIAKATHAKTYELTDKSVIFSSHSSHSASRFRVALRDQLNVYADQID